MIDVPRKWKKVLSSETPAEPHLFILARTWDSLASASWKLNTTSDGAGGGGGFRFP